VVHSGGAHARHHPDPPARRPRRCRPALLAIPSDAFTDKVTATVPRGMGPDVFIGPQDRLGGWVEPGNTVDPSGFHVDEATRQRFLPSTLEALTYRGELYGLPLNFKAITLIYNKKLVAQPPRTTRELEALARKLTRKEAGVYGLAFAYQDYYELAALQNGFGGHPEVAADKVLAAFYAQSRTAVPMPNIPEMTMMWSPATAALGAIMRGVDAEAALKKAQGQVETGVAGLKGRGAR
jgi:maltose-binding protein MalE